MSTLTHDDPRLTAYVLGELAEHERAEFERLLAGDAELRGEVAQIRAMSGDLARELAVDLADTPALTLRQRLTIAGASRPRARRRAVMGWGVFTAAAAAAIAFAVLPTIGQEEYETAPPRLAMTPAATTDTERARAPLPYSAVSAPVAAPVAISDEEVKKIVNAKSAPSLDQAITELELKPIEVAVINPSTNEEHTESDVAKGREEAVASSETGSTGAFMAIGAGGKSRGVSAHRRLAADTAVPPAEATTPGTATARAGYRLAPVAEPVVGAAPAPKAGGFRLAPPPSAAPVVPPTTAGGEAYNQRADNGFLASRAEPLSTFGLDVDTASYGNVRRMIESGRLPPRDAVRVEELVNYFSYDVPPPQNGEAFGVTVEVSACPWQPAHQLARIAVRAQDVAPAARPALNLVFLIDVSGSMQPENRLPLIKTGLSLLTTTLRDQDRIAIVTYANSAGVVLPSTSGTDQRTILKAIDGLTADGGTNGGSGIQLAYQAARERFVHGGINRVILCTDGDFNVGITNREELVGMVQERSKQGIFLTVLGVGQDNLKDATMELLADKANGHYHYLDTIAEARKVLVEQSGGTLMTVAKDVKAQVEFNPTRIAAWRQLGYEKRALAARDFNDDRKDAGEIGAGHLVTMLYELVPATVAPNGAGLRYQVEPPPAAAALPGYQDELMTVKVRFKAPDGDVSQLIQGVVTDAQVRRTPSEDQTFAAAVAAFALRLRGAEAMPLDWSTIRGLANAVRGRDPQGYRREFVTLVEQVAHLEGQRLPRE